MIITRDYGSFPHSLRSAPVRKSRKMCVAQEFENKETTIFCDFCILLQVLKYPLTQ